MITSGKLLVQSAKDAIKPAILKTMPANLAHLLSDLCADLEFQESLPPGTKSKPPGSTHLAATQAMQYRSCHA
jgi:hypothetical protein